MENKTLHEVCEAVGVSRRAIQGYEKAGLVSPSARNERGHLLYDELAQERIRQIKLYQQFGFTVKEIKDLLEAPNAEVKKALENQGMRLEAEKEQIELLIKKAYELIEII